MPRAVPFKASEPLGEMNVTPFIDVMLVMLVMLIITIPIQSHKLPVDLPQGKTTTRVDDTPHKLLIAANGAVYWDGNPVTDSQLPALLVPMAASEKAVLHFQTDPEARYVRFDEVLAIVKKSGITRLGFVGNQPLP